MLLTMIQANTITVIDQLILMIDSSVFCVMVLLLSSSSLNLSQMAEIN